MKKILTILSILLVALICFSQTIGPSNVTGGLPYHLLSAASTNATTVKASSGQVYTVVATNSNAAQRYLKFNDSAVSPTCGTTPVTQSYAIPGNTTGSGVVIPFPAGLGFANGISFCITGAVADNDTTSVGANEVIVNLTYK